MMHCNSKNKGKKGSCSKCSKVRTGKAKMPPQKKIKGSSYGK